MSGITWTFSSLIYFPLYVVLLGIMVWRLQKIRNSIAQLSSSTWRSVLIKNYSPTKIVIKTILFLIGLLFLFVALLHPRWGTKEETVVQQGRDLFIALDISRSMLAQDIKPSRLERAKGKIKKLLSMLSCERVGLLLFAGAPFVQCPLTSDYAAFFMFLDAVDAQMISAGSTALDQVIQKTIQLFEAMPTKKNKLLVILTDGEDFSTNLADIKKKAAQIGLHIFTIGIGTEQGAPIPIIDPFGNQRGVEKDSSGSVIMSRLNEEMLRTLAVDTGGTYIPVSHDDTDLKPLVRRVESYEKEAQEDKKISNQEEQYPYFLMVSLLCLTLEWIL